jgi:hypothetical protein
MAKGNQWTFSVNDLCGGEDLQLEELRRQVGRLLYGLPHPGATERASSGWPLAKSLVLGRNVPHSDGSVVAA